MICPKCHAEYFEKIKQCGDCIVDLVDASSTDLPVPKMTWATLKPIHGSIYAEMIIEILNKEDTGLTKKELVGIQKQRNSISKSSC